MSEVVLSGIRATGGLHFGNFLGAVQNFVKYQDGKNECLYFVADLHTLTTLIDPALLRANLLEMVKDYLAAGLDPEKSTIYVQSSVPEISELCLLLAMLQPVGELLSIPTYKEKIRGDANSVSHGLLTYPVLMAADILGPQSTLVPVGEDQVPNVELARDLARRFNNRYGDTFVVPEMMNNMVRVPGLSGGKMGKSDDTNAIGINMTGEDILRRYRKHGVTDPNRVTASDPGDPYNECRSVYPVHELVTPGEIETREIANACRSAEIGCAECKKRLVDGIMKILGPFQERRCELAEKDDFVREVLHEGGKKARVRIRPTVEAVREKMGIIIY
ncbi:MAG: tryptophan--tRNA ligase [Parcubacteria group bacterium CG_4_9_14_0_2_um_filter_41_8]|nr:MAG: tryptophan--tRNA ligase [Parcubacteria group bacterium CG_4_9_14_0_2_um_filter_41_8]